MRCLVHISRRMTSFSAHVGMAVWSPKPLPHPIFACLYLMMNGKECSFADSRAMRSFTSELRMGVNFPGSCCCWWCKYGGKLTGPPPTNTYRYTHGTVPWLLLLFGLLCWFTGLHTPPPTEINSPESQRGGMYSRSWGVLRERRFSDMVELSSKFII